MIGPEEMAQAQLRAVKFNCWMSVLFAIVVVFGLVGLFTHNKPAAAVFLLFVAVSRVLLDMLMRGINDYIVLKQLRALDKALKGEPPAPPGT